VSFQRFCQAKLCSDEGLDLSYRHKGQLIERKEVFLIPQCDVDLGLRSPERHGPQPFGDPGRNEGNHLQWDVSEFSRRDGGEPVLLF
jgi:hypothetical protein